ncbi:MAG: hydroxymethylbilane synthase [Hydrogenophilales bacterium]|nr:hydroxymethylbilane synthase [Hydrogenophilales bacterium]
MSSKQPSQLIIASRESLLALWQARHIQAKTRALYPELDVSILGMTTTGDQILDTPLAKIGGKGLFVKELEVAMADGRADIAVHSMKDVPMNLPEGFTLAAIGEREDPRDALVSNDYKHLADLPAGAVVGTSSLRRQALLKAHYPHLTIAPLRGNVQTRLRKLDEGQYAAIVLAAAGLKRLELSERIASTLAPSDSLPAVGQGAIGIECRDDRADLIELMAPLNHPGTAACVSAERAMSRRLAGSCQTPLGGYAQILNGQLSLTGFVADLEGKRFVQATLAGPPADAEKIGMALAEELLAQGAGKILAELGVLV